MRTELPNLKEPSSWEKDELIIELWEENVRLRGENQELKTQIIELEKRLAAIEEKLNKPPKTSSNSSVPPSQTKKKNRRGRMKGIRREASVGREGGGRELNETPDQIIIAKVKVCPHCAAAIAAEQQKLIAVYEKIEIPQISPIVTQINQYGGKCEHCQKEYLAPVPVVMEQGSPFGNTIKSLATYYRYTHALSYERLKDMFRDVFNLSISEGALANLFVNVKHKFDSHVMAILNRLQSSRLICSDETSVRVDGKNQWEWVFQNQEVCLHIIRPSRGECQEFCVS
jgi:transposase